MANEAVQCRFTHSLSAPSFRPSICAKHPGDLRLSRRYYMTEG
jgi:hypothetical protein